jgi:hypothetical protein
MLLAGLGAAPAVLLGCRSGGEGPSRSDATPRAAQNTRSVLQVVDAQPSVDGAGVKLRRALGSRALPMLDPFLMLDEIHSEAPEDYVAGFPDHPHRGFETVTYMIEGAMEHRDSVGNHGRLVPGSTQWMTAGRGIVHSEMPKQERGELWGLQLWVNLPRTHKLTRPRYQDIPPEQIPELSVAGARVRVVAGRAAREQGPVAGIVVDPTLLDVTLPGHGRFEHELPSDYTAFAWVLSGSLEMGAAYTTVASGQLAVLGPGQVFTSKSGSGARYLLAAARRLDEPVARRGPFVMNTQEELRQAFEDYRSGRLVDG